MPRYWPIRRACASNFFRAPAQAGPGERRVRAKGLSGYSSVTYGARGQKFAVADSVSFGETTSQLELVSIRLPFHVENLLYRTEIFFGISVAVQAPFHQQRRHLVGKRHLVDTAMTRRTADAFVNVNAVIEIDKTRQVID